MSRARVVKKASGTAAGKPVASPVAKVKWKLPVAMTGRASPAKAAVGDQPVFAYWMKQATAIPGFGKKGR